MNQNIAIDGPAGAGKSTIAKRVAANLQYVYVDTGAMYRAIGIFCVRCGVDPTDEALVSEVCQKAEISIAYEEGQQQVYLNGENVTHLLRTEDAGRMASAVSVYPAVRKKLVELQQALAAKTAVVMDGRDIGTVVLPDARLKVYLTASVETRARRRYEELTAKGEACDMAKISADIEKRDYQDMHREVSPLRQAEDAVYLDSSDKNIEEVTQLIISLLKERLA